MSLLLDDVQARIDAIEEAYEFMLAYAAQGLTSDQGSKSGGQLRDFLAGAEHALTGLAAGVRALVAEGEIEGPGDAWNAMLEVLGRDAEAARAAVALVRARAGISSQLVDNLNANLHLRALLTDLFLIDDLLGD